MLGTMPALGRRRSVWGLAADRLDPTSETYRASRERDAAMADVRAFARHARIQDAFGQEQQFSIVGWLWQFVLLQIWALPTSNRVVTLKARQLGVSWMAALYALWVCMRQPGQVVLLISKQQGDANKLLEKVAYIFERLPAWRGSAQVNTESITFANGSEIQAMPAKPGVGRSRTANLVILDEHGFQPWARQILLAIYGAAEKGQILSISSGNGAGALHSQLYTKARRVAGMAPIRVDDKVLPILVSRGNNEGWRAVFVPFDAHPDRSAAWRAAKRDELEQLSDEEFNQEYPADDVEAIMRTGRTVFDVEALQAMPLERGTPGAFAGIVGAVIYRTPEPKAAYVLAADPAEGNADSDWSSASVLRVEQVDAAGFHAEQVAVLRGRWAPEVFAEKLDKLARAYCLAGDNGTFVLVAWERNNHGHAVRVALEEIERRHHPPYAMYRAKDKKRGWNQTEESRTVLIDQLAAAIRLRHLVLHDGGSVDQLIRFQENDRGRAEAPEGEHDDDVIAVGLGWQMRRSAFPRVLALPKRDTEVKAA